MFGIKKFLNGLKIVPKTATSADSKGELEVINSTGKLGYHNGTSVSPVVTESHSATLTNKIIDADSNTITNIENADIKAAAAIDASKIADGSVSSTEFQYINSLTSNAQTQISAAQSTADNHISDAVDAHDASAISSIPSGNLAATEVQAALNELQTDVDTRATSSALTTHINNTTGAHAASAISSTPSGNLAAIEVQAALNELQTDVDTRATSTALTTHTGASTGVHGVTGSVVGTSDSQTLTNKTITGADIRTPVRSDVKQDTKANLTTYALTASNGQLCFATDTKEMFQVVDTLLESVGGGAGIGGVDILFSQTFEEAALTDFTQTGLSLSTSSPLHGAISALMTHQAATSQSFKQVIAVDEKFRGQAMLLELNVKSTASAGNVTLKVYDETNAANIVASEQLTLSSDTGGIKVFSAFTIPVTCLSMSYTITALQEAGSPVTRIDDILCQLNNASLLETSVTVPVIETQESQIVQSVTITTGSTVTGVLTSSSGSGIFSYVSGTGVYTVLKDGIFDLSFSQQAATAVRGDASIVVNGTIISRGTNDAGTTSYSSTSTQIKLAATDTFFFRNDGTGSSNVQYIAVSAVYNGTQDVAIPLTQSGLVQEADSALRMSSASKSGDVILFANVEESKGNAVSYSAGQFTVSVDGIYDIGTMVTMAGTDNKVLITKNSTSTSTVAASTLSWGSTHNTGGYEAKAFWSGPLVSGDVIRFISSATLSASAANQKMFISHQGSLKQVNINTNSKITIPTSELRFEGASARGAVATAIVKFDTMAKIRGDAFTVTNTANDGTYVTMTKAGKLDVSTSIRLTAAGTVFAITKNQASLTTVGTASEILVTGVKANAALDGQTLSTSIFVNIGDIIRVSSDQALTSLASASFNLSFQEQDIQVSVSNTLPQFSESDSSVRLDTANGYGSTNTTTRRFASVIQNLGTDIEYTDSATLGGQFTAKSSGIYSATFSEASAANANRTGILIYVNGLEVSRAADTYLTASTATKSVSCSWQGYLSIGDIVSAAVFSPSQNDGAVCNFTMSKVGKPNVTGVDVTPFVNVPQPVSQSLLSISNTATPTLTTVTNSSGSGLFSVSGDTITALRTISVSASYTMYGVASGASLWLVEIQKNASLIAREATGTVNNGVFYYVSTSASVTLNAGESLTITRTISSGGITAPAHYVSLVATATSDQILTAPETFSTDTAPLTYAGLGTYTLATLANAKVGTFITFTYATSTNTRTQTTAAPTQTTADMNTNGMLIYTRAYNAASTAALPAVFAIQLGKGLKGKSLDFYKSAGKVTAGSLDTVVQSATTLTGCFYKDYNEVTGILIVDAGLATATTVSHTFEFSDTTAQTSGYVVINASKNPALTGLGLRTVAARGVSTSGQSIPNTATFTVMVLDAAKTYDTHAALNAATGVFTAPESGYYQASGNAYYTTATYAVGNSIATGIFKNGVLFSGGTILYMDVAAPRDVTSTASTGMYLVKGDTVDFRTSTNRTAGAATLVTSSGPNFFSIHKTSVGTGN